MTLNCTQTSEIYNNGLNHLYLCLVQLWGKKNYSRQDFSGNLWVSESIISLYM